MRENGEIEGAERREIHIGKERELEKYESSRGGHGRECV